MIVEYYYSIEPEVEEMEGNEFDLFMACREVQGDAAVPSDEVDKYVELTKETNNKCKDAIECWMTVGKWKFPTLARRALNTLMIMGSSVPSESAFSDSGDFVTAERSSITGENICIMMKLRPWRRATNKR
jgi:hAT family C-terminal dimerisation region